MLNRVEIIERLPHGDPFVFLDEAQLKGAQMLGRYLITGKESFLYGHFPDRPVFPASIMVEALGQLGVLFLIESHATQPIENDSIYFIKSEDTVCKRMCVPGDVLEMTVTRRICREPLISLTGEIRVLDELAVKVSSFTLSFAFSKKGGNNQCNE